MTWILLLTLVSYDGAALTQIPGFTSVVECKTAGDLWLKANPPTRGAGDYQRVVSTTAICIAKSPALASDQPIPFKILK